jgi:hypothetical protein
MSNYDQQSLWGGQARKVQMQALDLSGATKRLVTLKGGDGEQYRKASKEGKLRCPIGNCPQPNMIVKAGSKVQHHFAHTSQDSAHSPESLNHHAGKEMLMRWIQRRYPSLEAELEVTLENGRRADVLVTSPESGRRLAFEIQYSSISLDDWQQRHDDYKEIGVDDIWIWGHVGANCRRDTEYQGLNGAGLMSSAVLTACAEQTGFLLFINPEQGKIGQGFTLDMLRTVKGLLNFYEDSFANPIWPPPQCDSEYIRNRRYSRRDSIALTSFDIEECELRLAEDGSISMLASQYQPFLLQVAEIEKVVKERPHGQWVLSYR